MNILVTGATGFIGTHLIYELLKEKSNKIIATSRSIEKAKRFDWFDKVKYIEYDLNAVAEKNLYDFFGKPDQLIHLAWDNLSNYTDLVHIEKHLPTHYGFIKNMLEGGLKNIAITGTCFEYGMLDGCLNEEMNTNPSNSYAIAKDTLRKFIVELEKKYTFTYIWIRLFYMYGEGQSEKSLIYLLDKAIKNKDLEFNMSKGEQLRDFLPISKVVENIVLIATQNIYLNQVINCCNGTPISVKDLVETYLKDKTYNMKLNLGFYPYPNYEPMEFWGNNCKLKKIKGN